MTNNNKYSFKTIFINRKVAKLVSSVVDLKQKEKNI